MPRPRQCAGRCAATLRSGAPCRWRASRRGGMCGVHSNDVSGEPGEPQDPGEPGDPANECPICAEDLGKRTFKTACGHAFHARCLRAWYRRCGAVACPMCRSPCLEGLAMLPGGAGPRLEALLRTLPPPPRAFFPSYIVGHLESEAVRGVLGAAKAELLVDLACECFTRDVFFANVEALGL